MSGANNNNNSHQRSMDSAPSVSSLRDSVHFWRGVVGYRQADYRGDAPERVSGITMDQTQINTGGGLRNRNMTNNSLHTDEAHIPGMSMISTTSTQAPGQHPVTARRGANNVWGRLKNASDRNRILTKILNSSGWKGVLIACSTIILFGAQLRDMFVPKSADATVDVIFVMVLTFLVVDIVLRSDTEPAYFVCYSCRGWNVGSFLFWCDFWSTITLLYDIRGLTERLGVNEVVITLNEQGIPVRENVFGGVVLRLPHIYHRCQEWIRSIDTYQ